MSNKNQFEETIKHIKKQNSQYNKIIKEAQKAIRINELKIDDLKLKSSFYKDFLRMGKNE